MADSADPADPTNPDSADAADTAELADMGEEEFVSLTTFRRSGVAVSVPVWIAPGPDADGALLITTTRDSGKVRRLRRDARVTLRPCARRGEVAPGTPTVRAEAEIVEDPVQVRRYRAVLRAKYGERMKVTAADEEAATANREAAPARVILRITVPSL